MDDPIPRQPSALTVKNDRKEVMKHPNIPTILGRASPEAGRPEVLLPNLWGARATMSGMGAIGWSAVAEDLSREDMRWPQCASFDEGEL